MAASERLLQQVRTALAAERGVTEVKMFGGVCFMFRGHMLCGVESDRFMLRVGPEHEAKALSLAGASPMDFTGRPLKGFVYVEAGRRLAPFLALALSYVSALPAKKNAKKRKPKPHARKAGRA